jgi:type II secretory pathway component PulC
VGQLLVLACATREKPVRSPAVVTAAAASSADDAGAAEPAESPSAHDKTLQPGPVGADPAYVGVLDRKGLVAVIEQGLGRMLARLKLSAVMNKGRFAGFRVTEIDPAWGAAGIEKGDVLLRLNGQTIERPEQAQEAFESLRVASEVALELVRGEEKRSLRYRIE